MTVTVRDVIKRSLRMLRVTGLAEEPAADDAQVALDGYNDMLKRWSLNGVIDDPDEAVLADEVAFDRKYHSGMAAILAMDLAEEFGKPIGQGVQRLAALTWSAIYDNYLASRFIATMPDTMTTMPLTRQFDDITTEVNPAQYDAEDSDLLEDVE